MGTKGERCKWRLHMAGCRSAIRRWLGVTPWLEGRSRPERLATKLPAPSKLSTKGTSLPTMGTITATRIRSSTETRKRARRQRRGLVMKGQRVSTIR